MSRTLVAVVAVSAIAVSNSCGREALLNEPSPAVQPITGKWTGAYRVVSCFGGFEACHDVQPSYVITLMLDQSTNDTVTGMFSGQIPAGFTNPQVIAESAPIALNGSLDASHTLVLQGSRPFVYGDSACVGCQTGVTFTNWMTSVDAAGMSMTGGFRMALIFRTNNAYPNNWTMQCELVSLRRSS
jgi:hypothetical protein